MYPSTSSYRSSASSNRRLRRTRQSQECGHDDNKSTIAYNTDTRSRGYSNDYSAASGKSASVSTSSVSNSSTASERLQKDLHSEAPLMIFLRTLIIRCFTTRTKRRSRGPATRKMKNNNYQTRDDDGNIHGVDPQNSKGYSSIPTNEHEMFFMLHSHSKVKRNMILRPSGDGRPSIHRRHNRAMITSRETTQPVQSNCPPILVIEHRIEGQPLLLA